MGVIGTYIQKPTTIEAVNWTGSALDEREVIDWVQKNGGAAWAPGPGLLRISNNPDATPTTIDAVTITAGHFIILFKGTFRVLTKNNFVARFMAETFESAILCAR